MLKKLKANNENRRNLAKTYSGELTNKITVPHEEKWANHVYHLFTVRTEKRDLLKDYLLKNEIETGIHYPIPIHKQPLFKKYVKEKLPITEEICKTTLSLPMFPSLNKKQQKYIITRVNNFFIGNHK